MGFGAAAAREAMLSDAEAQRWNDSAHASRAYLDEVLKPQLRRASSKAISAEPAPNSR